MCVTVKKFGGSEKSRCALVNLKKLTICLSEGLLPSHKPEMLSPRGQSGLEAKILASASVSASKLWPRPRPWPQTFGLGLASVCSRRTSSKEEMDGPICLHFALPTTGHHSMIEDSYCARGRMRSQVKSSQVETGFLIVMI